jgi:predicted DsbA family dithiol-disulfide isomerase
MTRRFGITWDYRCPFAYNVHAAIVAALRAGEPLEVSFIPFSLDQGRLEPGDIAIWDRPPEARGSGMAALCFGVAVRDHFPEVFPEFHLAVFAARHDEARAIAEPAVLRGIAASVGLDADALADLAADPATLDRIAADHTAAVEAHDVWGVPTFITATSATYVRLMERGRVDDLLRILDLLDLESINEFKRTRVPR